MYIWWIFNKCLLMSPIYVWWRLRAWSSTMFEPQHLLDSATQPWHLTFNQIHKTCTLYTWHQDKKDRKGNTKIRSTKVHTHLTPHTVPHVTLLVSSGKFTSGLDFFLSPPENKKAKFAFCTLKRNVQSTQKQPFLTVRFRGALLTKSVTLEFSQGTVCRGSLILRNG